MSANTESAAEKKRKHEHSHPDSKPPKRAKKNSGAKSKSKKAQGSLQTGVAASDHYKTPNGLSGALGLGGEVDWSTTPQKGEEATIEELEKLRTKDAKIERKEAKKKKKKKEKKSKHTTGDGDMPLVEDPVSEGGVDSLSSLKENATELPNSSSSPPWIASAPIGDLFQKLDPIFSLDERYMISEAMYMQFAKSKQTSALGSKSQS